MSLHTLENIFFVFNTKPHEKGHVERVLLGKFLLNNGHFEILEDHGLPEGLDTLPPAEAAKQIHRLTTSMYFEVVNMQDLVNGLHPDLIKDKATQDALHDDIKTVIGKSSKDEPENDFEYDRIGSEGPKKLSISDGQVFLDGHLLTEEEVNKIQEHVQTGQAYLKKITKAKLNKSEADPKIHRILNEDSSIPGVGNLKAFKEFKASNPKGMNISINAHDIKDINSSFDHETGHTAVRAIGLMINHGVRSLAGKDGHVFRIGGDKFLVHLPSPELAGMFARHLRQHLEGIPPVGGSHNLSVSMGIGPTLEHSQWALHSATAEKNRSQYKPGQSQTHIDFKG